MENETTNNIPTLDQYRESLRRFDPLKRGLPWAMKSHCPGCSRQVDAVFSRLNGKVVLEWDCPDCGKKNQPHHDTIFTEDYPSDRPDGPSQTRSGFRIQPVLRELPRTVETLCPECGCVILGRNFEDAGRVMMEKTCPEHGYFRDCVNSDVRVYLKAAQWSFEDEAGLSHPQTPGTGRCPTDCGLCGQHLSASCLGQIDLTNRCNLNCPVCFASANEREKRYEPSFEQIVELLTMLRAQKPHPPTAVQFTGGEPTVHPRFLDCCRKANEMGFSHVQAATNGVKLAQIEFARKAAKAGLHTLYLQFDGCDDEVYKTLRGKPLFEIKKKVLDNCRKTNMKVVFVPTLVKGVNGHLVEEIFRFAVDNIDVVSAISYQPVSFSGRISEQEREAKRFTLGDMAHGVARAAGCDPVEDMFPLSLAVPMGRILQALTGNPKMRPSCHPDCSLGSYFVVSPSKQVVSLPQLMDIPRWFTGLNEKAKKIEARGRGKGNWMDWVWLYWHTRRCFNWAAAPEGMTPYQWLRALRGLTNKKYGRGKHEKKSYRTLMAAGMHFMDRYNYDVERVKRCVILYATPAGCFPFCSINCGPAYRPFTENPGQSSRAEPHLE